MDVKCSLVPRYYIITFPSQYSINAVIKIHYVAKRILGNSIYNSLLNAFPRRDGCASHMARLTSVLKSSSREYEYEKLCN